MSAGSASSTSANESFALRDPSSIPSRIRSAARCSCSNAMRVSLALLLLPHDLDRHVSGAYPAPARQPDLREVIDVPEVLLLLVGERVQGVCTAHDLHPAQPAR